MSDSHAVPRGTTAVTAGRLLGNASFRVIFPFLPTIARGLGVSLSTMGAALAIRSVSAFLAPTIGQLVDRNSYVRVMFGSLVLGAFAALLAGLAGGIVLFTAALTVGSIAKATYDTASASWVGATVSFARRGRIMSIVESAWALSFLIVMPVFALVIRLSTWRVPFYLLAIAMLAAAFLIERQVPQRAFAPSGASGRFPPPSRVMWPTLAAAIAIGMGHEFILVTFATWLEDVHDLDISGLGGLAILLGVSELAATLLCVRYLDRVGKMNGVQLGSLLLVPICALLTIGERRLLAAFLLLGVLFFVFEYMFISFVSLISQLDPAARGGAISYGFGAVALGEIAGAPVAPLVYEGPGMLWVTIVAAGLFGTASTIMHLLVDEPTEHGD